MLLHANTIRVAVLKKHYYEKYPAGADVHVRALLFRFFSYLCSTRWRGLVVRALYFKYFLYL